MFPNPSAEAGIKQSKLCTVTSVHSSPCGEAGVPAAHVCCVFFCSDVEGVCLSSGTWFIYLLIIVILECWITLANYTLKLRIESDMLLVPIFISLLVAVFCKIG